MKKIKIFKTRSEFESFVNSVDVEILQIDIKAVEVSFYFQDGFAAVVFYKENNDNNNDDNDVNRPITKEKAIKILQDAYDRGIDPDEDVEIFDAIKLAIECLRSDPFAPLWSQAPEWAQWYAIDPNRDCFWYENEPIEKEKGFYCFSKGRVKFNDQNKVRQTLYKRPKE